jgi:ribosomal protein L37AE/L43A
MAEKQADPTDISKYYEWKGQVPAPGKEKTHNITLCVFTCPKCGTEIKNTSYINFGYFRKATEKHFKDCKGKHEQKPAKEVS